MAYSDFTLEMVRKQLGITFEQGRMFTNSTPLTISPWLGEALDRARQLPLLNERARSELVVMPILLESRALCRGKLTIYPGERLDVDPEKGLIGECDYLLSVAPPLPMLQAPIATIVEAKKGDIDLGLPQCAAQMVAARIFNQREGRNVSTIYGCVTTAHDWQFLRLSDSTIVFDERQYFLIEVGTILGIFQTIIAACQPEMAAA